MLEGWRHGDALAAARLLPCAYDASVKTLISAIEALRQGGRRSEATLAEAFHHAVCRRTAEAVDALTSLVEQPELPFTGWTIPIEPLFAPLRKTREFQGILATLAAHAR